MQELCQGHERLTPSSISGNIPWKNHYQLKKKKAFEAFFSLLATVQSCFFFFLSPSVGEICMQSDEYN